jgi:hypothetical protein
MAQALDPDQFAVLRPSATEPSREASKRLAGRCTGRLAGIERARADWTALDRTDHGGAERCTGIELIDIV